MNKDAKMVLLAVSLLVMIGVVMIYSSSAVYAYGKFGDSLYFVKRHLMHLTLGLIAAICCMAVPVRKIAGSARWTMVFFILLLVAVLVPGIGRQVGGARRWMCFPGFSFQPSEIAKLALIIYLADLTSRRRHLIENFKYGFVPPLSIIGLTAFLIFLEPDMGTSVSVIFIGLAILFASGARLRHLSSIGIAMVPALYLAVVFAPYRVRRIMAFLDPWGDARGAGFQLIQSFIALGSGGLWGVGLGRSRQKLFYLPESHTDFIFSIIGEELGFLRTAFVFLLFAVLIWFSFRLSFRIRDRFASRAVFGIGVMIAFEVIVNIGVSTGMLPTKGLPLPFISYGGSSLVCHLAATVILLNMSREAG